ncbi:unnamed protein product [Candidula unifasciata]|uniref:DNA polymerase delta subunit 4 n=1 Tax=Candidula unifasciata TaxID=100452 RepID=A0A8S3ZKX6_9EUPU|nr:unnamed protein product [Candidula unifasciata]
MASKTKSKSKNKRVNRAFRQRKRNPRPYSKAKPTTAKTPLVSEAEKELGILKKFDLTLEFGPCIGITRLERWERAEKHGLNPPTEVKIIISKHSSSEAYTDCLWSDYIILK